MNQSVHIEGCKAAQKRFLNFEESGSFKKMSKIGGNVAEFKAYRLVPLMPPFLCHETVHIKYIIYATDKF
jgi:hypothetical protein